MSRIEDLYHLQEIDLDLTARARRLAEVRGQLGENEELRQARQQLAGRRAQHQQQRAQQRDLELTMASLVEKLEQSEQRMYSGSVRNPKVLTDLQAEILSLKRRRTRIEDELLEAMLTVDECQAQVAEAEAHLSGVESRWGVGQAALEAEQAQLEGQLGALAAKRRSISTRVPSGMLDAYEKLRQRKGGTVVAVVRDEACGVCGVDIPPGRVQEAAGDKLVTCGNCDRILLVR